MAIGNIILIFILAAFALEIVLLLQVIQNPKIDNNNKIFWVVLIIFTQVLGLIIYFLVEDKNVLK